MLSYLSPLNLFLIFLQFESDPEHRAHQIVCGRLIDEVVCELVPVVVKKANHELVLG